LDVTYRGRSPSTWNLNASGTRSHVVPYVRHVHLHDLTDEFPYRELFRLLTASDYTGYTSAELPESADPERVLHYYHALWEAYVREVG
jgi:sugar phosphate isomerase/epimerase